MTPVPRPDVKNPGSPKPRFALVNGFGGVWQTGGMLRNMFRWGRAKAVTQCSCEPQWQGLYTELDGQRQLALPRDEMATIVGYLDLTAHCAGCDAEYPKPWGLASR
jgi:hypothetical protein